MLSAECIFLSLVNAGVLGILLFRSFFSFVVIEFHTISISLTTRCYLPFLICHFLSINIFKMAPYDMFIEILWFFMSIVCCFSLFSVHSTLRMFFITFSLLLFRFWISLLQQVLVQILFSRSFEIDRVWFVLNLVCPQRWFLTVCSQSSSQIEEVLLG